LVTLHVKDDGQVDALTKYGFNEDQLEAVEDALAAQGGHPVPVAIDNDGTARIYVMAPPINAHVNAMEPEGADDEKVDDDDDVLPVVDEEQVDQVGQVEEVESEEFIPSVVEPPMIESIVLSNGHVIDVAQSVGCKTIGEVLAKVDSASSGATHVVVTLLIDGKRCKIPYSCSPQNGGEAFPFEHVPDLTDAVDSIELLSMAPGSGAGELQGQDMMPALYDFSFELFKCGFATFRPHAWTWLAGLCIGDTKALITIGQGPKIALLGKTKIAFIHIHDPVEPEWFVSNT